MLDEGEAGERAAEAGRECDHGIPSTGHRNCPNPHCLVSSTDTKSPLHKSFISVSNLPLSAPESIPVTIDVNIVDR
jgi:hypothetical protein